MHTAANRTASQSLRQSQATQLSCVLSFSKEIEPGKVCLQQEYRTLQHFDIPSTLQLVPKFFPRCRMWVRAVSPKTTAALAASNSNFLGRLCGAPLSARINSCSISRSWNGMFLSRRVSRKTTNKDRMPASQAANPRTVSHAVLHQSWLKRFSEHRGSSSRPRLPAAEVRL